MDSLQPFVACQLSWARVPQQVQDLYIKYASDVRTLMDLNPEADEWELSTPEVGPVIIKRAENFFPWLGRAMHNTQVPMGGPNPLTSMLLGGAFGAGAAGLGGLAASTFAPETFEEDTWKRWAMLGGLGGAAVPGFVHGYPNVKEHGWVKGLLTPSELQGGPKYKNTTHTASSRFTGVVDRLAEAANVVCDDPFLKECADVAGGSLRNIPVDDWGRVIMRDPLLSSQQKAVVAGLPYAAGAARGSRWVSPIDVARVAANAGLGAFMGKAIGSIAGPFLGLTTKAREGIQRAGLLAGAVKMLTGL